MGTGAGLAYLGAGLATGMACIGAGIAVANGASAAIGACAEDPKSFGRSIVFVHWAKVLQSRTFDLHHDHQLHRLRAGIAYETLLYQR